MRLGALQALLVLGLIGRFGRHPDSGSSAAGVRRCMIDSCCRTSSSNDLRGVVADLVAAHYPFQLDWFQPLFDLRFPVLGSVPIGPLTLKLRSAHEPWPLLAEEATAGGVARFVDACQRAPASDPLGSASGPICARLQRPPRAATGHRHARRIHRRRSLQGFEPSGDAAPDGPAGRRRSYSTSSTPGPGPPSAAAPIYRPSPRCGAPIRRSRTQPPRPTGEPREAPRVFPIPILSMRSMGKSGRFLPHGSGLGP